MKSKTMACDEREAVGNSIKTVAWLPFLVFLFASIVLIKQASEHYVNATVQAAESVPYQCGHMVFARSLQLLGIPIQDLSVLPSRKSGISIGELKEAFESLGVKASIDYVNRKDFDPPPLSIFKLNFPRHFIVVENVDENQKVRIHTIGQPPFVCDFKEVSDRFSGYLLDIPKELLPLNNAASLEGSLPKFDVLFQHFEAIDYNELNDSVIEFSVRV